MRLLLFLLLYAKILNNSFRIQHLAFRIQNAFVAQLDRASDSDSEGRWFDSSRARQKTKGFAFLQILFSFYHSLIISGFSKTLSRVLMYGTTSLSAPILWSKVSVIGITFLTPKSISPLLFLNTNSLS